jgi:RNA polymerase sigma factor (sigma-70 family)
VLPRRQRVVLALRYFEDMDDAHIATILGCRAGTVRGYASRALATLRNAAAAEHALEKGTH